MPVAISYTVRVNLFTRVLLVLLSFSLLPLFLVSAWVLRSNKMAKENASSFHAQLAHFGVETLEQAASDMNRALSFVQDLEEAGGKKWDEFKILQRASANPQFAILSLLGPDGKEYLRTSDNRLSSNAFEDRSSDPIVSNARSSGRVSLGSVELLGNVPVLSLAYPLEGGRILYAGYSLEGLWRRFKARRVGKSGGVFMYDGSGRPLPGQEGARPVAGMRGEKGWLDASSEDWVGAFEKSPSLGWYVSTRQPRAEAYLTEGTFRLELLAGITFLTVCVLLASAVVTKKLTMPLEELIAGARRVAHNEFQKPVRLEGWEKLRELADTFNQMMQRLKKYQEIQIDSLLAEKAKVETLVNAIPDGVALATLRGDPEYVNRQALAPLGLSASADGAGPLHARIPLEAFRDSIQRMTKKGASQELIEVRQDGHSTYYKCQVFICSHVNQGNKEPAVLYFLHDVTLQERLNAMKEEFFHSIVHDLRNPLSTIKGFLEFMVQKGMLDERANTYIPVIRQSTATLQQLIADILDAAKLESGTLTLRIEKSDTHKMLDMMQGMFGLTTEKQGKTFLAEKSGAPIEFEADRQLIERVVMNLIGNALKFTPEGGKITLTAVGVDDGRMVKFAVADTGPGIPASQIESIFEKFKQLEGEQKRAGYGLGLAICRKAVELHGGRIWAESTVGKGTTFVFKIPVKPAEATASKTTA